MINLQIELIEKLEYDDFERMWVCLTCGWESRQICFEPCYDGLWQYLDGDNEPSMPDSIKRIWDSRVGDDILTSLWNGDFTYTTIEA